MTQLPLPSLSGMNFDHYNRYDLCPYCSSLFLKSSKSESDKVLVLKFPLYMPEEMIKVDIWNGSVHSRFGTEGKTVIQIHPDQSQILVQFKFNTNFFNFDNFGEGKS